MGKGKCSKIRHIVRLRQMLRRWRLRAASSSSRCAPSDVPAGHVAVCVGSSSRRFVVLAAHLNHPVFRKLLSQAEEEYGFSSEPGPLSLPCCDESLFEHVLRHISSSSSSRFANLEDMHKSSSSCCCCCCCCHVGLRSPWQPDTLPLLRGRLVEKSVWY